MNRAHARGISLIVLLAVIVVLGVIAAALAQLYVTSAQLSSDRTARAQAEAVAEAALAQASVWVRNPAEDAEETCNDLTQISVSLNGATGEIVDARWLSGRCHVQARGTAAVAERHVRGVLRGYGELLARPDAWSAQTEDVIDDAEPGVLTLCPDPEPPGAGVGPGPCRGGGNLSRHASITADNSEKLFPTRFLDDEELLPISSEGQDAWFAAAVIPEQDDEPITMGIEVTAAGGSLVCDDLTINEDGEAEGGSGCTVAPGDDIPDELNDANVVVAFDESVDIDDIEAITLTFETQAIRVFIGFPCLGRPGYCAAHTRPLEPWTWAYTDAE